MAILRQIKSSQNMKMPLRLVEFKDKVCKSKEIASFYLSRYMGWQRMPEPDLSFFTNLKSDKGVIKKLLLQDINEDGVIQDANRICSGEFRLYGLNLKTFKNGINWHKDYYSGYEWPLKPFNRIYSSPDIRKDLNVPWELSRMQFIPTLIQAFEITSDSKYLKGLTDLIDSWICKNPYCFGVNWFTGMEAALRAVSLVLAIGFFANSIERKKLIIYLKVLWKHALYIHKYDIQKDKIQTKNNHFMGSMLGLFVVTSFYKGAEVEKWRDYALNAIKNEIPRQFLMDGGNFESATGYHQFSLEVILVLILFCRVYYDNDISKDYINTLFGKGIHERLVNALNLVWDYMSCYGESPHIGDSSDCRVIVFKDYFDRDVSDHSFLFKLGKLALDYKIPSNKDRIAKLYPNAGYACFKNKIYGIIGFAGPKGTSGTGGHGHNDKCSFIMRVGGQPIFVDSGTYIYYPKSQERFELKWGKAHNIVQIDNKEQCLITPELVFGLIGEINSEIKLEEHASMMKIKMHHDGYQRLDELSVVSREIICKEGIIEINDSVHGSGNHTVSIFFNLHPLVTTETFDNNIVYIKNGNSNIKLIFPRYFRIHLEDSLYSAFYRSKIESIRIIASGNIDLPTSWKTIMEIL